MVATFFTVFDAFDFAAGALDLATFGFDADTFAERFAGDFGCASFARPGAAAAVVARAFAVLPFRGGAALADDFAAGPDGLFGLRVRSSLPISGSRKLYLSGKRRKCPGLGRLRVRLSPDLHGLFRESNSRARFKCLKCPVK
jgi:hypothetical protein